MSALRKAGVWLGLVEDEDERHQDGIFDDLDDEDDFDPPVRPRPLARASSRGIDREASRGFDRGGSVRESFARDSSTHENSAHENSARENSARDSFDRESPDRDRRTGDRYEREAPADRVRADRPHWETRADRPERDPRAGRPEPDPRLGDREARPDRGGSVRQLPRQVPTPPGALRFPTQDNLALAPQVQLRERAVVNDETSRRYQITTLHPTTYNEARTIGEHFRDGYPVIMNLTEMAEADAKRLVDFAAGLAFGLRGSMERVTNRVFLLSPPNIQVSAEDKARIAEGGFFDQA